MTETKWTPGRRAVVKGIGGCARRAVRRARRWRPTTRRSASPWSRRRSPTTRDYLNGAKLAVDEINAAGGVSGRPDQDRAPRLRHLHAGRHAERDIARSSDTKPHAIGYAFMLHALAMRSRPRRLQGADPDRRHQLRPDHLRQEKPRQVLELLPGRSAGNLLRPDVPEIPRPGRRRRRVEADQQQGPHHPRAEQLQHADRAARWWRRCRAASSSSPRSPTSSTPCRTGAR